MTNYPSESVNVGGCQFWCFRLLHATLDQMTTLSHASSVCKHTYVHVCAHINKINEIYARMFFFLFFGKLQLLNSSSNSFYCIQFDYIIIFTTFIIYTLICR